ncbi:MAG TPA: hypothetical protein VGU20_04755 [Stellaceae bacterium]|nr:hypothetical protein [Stellaceae bacterium]
MTSNLQIEANRRNARRSTGPRTAQGKRSSRMNALRHGLTAQHVTVFDETEADFRRFHRQLMRVLRPEGAMEAQLAERAVICAWRLRRVYRIETGMFSKARKLWAPTGPTLANDIEIVYTRLSSQRDDLAKLSRYEASIQRSLRRALLDLERRQARRRKGEELDRLFLIGKASNQSTPT